MLGGRRLHDSQGGPQPIQYKDIVSYMDENWIIDPDTRESFVDHVETMDNVEIIHTINKMKANQDKGKKS